MAPASNRPCHHLRVHAPSLSALVLGRILIVSATLLALISLVFSRPRGTDGSWNRDGLQSAGLVLCYSCRTLAGEPRRDVGRSRMRVASNSNQSRGGPRFADPWMPNS